MSSNLTAIFEVTSIDGQSLSTSLSNDINIAAEASTQTFRIGNFNNGGTTYMSINSNIGIGTTLPLSVLHINSINPYLRLQDSGNAGSITSQLQFYTSTNLLEGYIGYYNSSNLLISNNDPNGSINLRTNNIDRIILNNTGYVGIGTNAQVPLHIYQDKPIIRLQDDVMSGTTNSHLEFYNTSSLEGYIGYTGTSNLTIANSNSTGDLHLKTTGFFGSTKLLVTNSGDIGIGTYPATSLHISASTAQIRLQDKDSLSGSISSLIQFYTPTASEGLLGYLGTADLNIINSNNSGSLILKTANLSRLTINNNGLLQTSCNIGIGTTPLTALHLYYSSPRIRIQDKDNTSGTITSQLQFYSIGASEGQIGYEGTPDFYITNSNSAAVIIKTSGLPSLTISSAGISNIGSIQSGGNLGIGTTPSANIHILDSKPLIRIQDKNNPSGTIVSLLQFYNRNIGEGSIGYTGTPDLVVNNSNIFGSVVLKTANLARFSIGNTGLVQSSCNIGIGTSPATNVHIADFAPKIRLQDINPSGSNNSKIEFYNASNIDGLIGYDGSNNLNIVNSNVTGSFVFKSGSNIVYSISGNGTIITSGNIINTGNVGIGTSALTSLHIATVQPQVRIQDSYSSTGATKSQIQFYNSTTLEGLVGYEGNSNLIVSNANTSGAIRIRTGGGACNLDRFIINSSGCIGIGTGNPTSILHINGTLNVKRIRVG